MSCAGRCRTQRCPRSYCRKVCSKGSACHWAGEKTELNSYSHSHHLHKARFLSTMLSFLSLYLSLDRQSAEPSTLHQVFPRSVISAGWFAILWTHAWHSELCFLFSENVRKTKRHLMNPQKTECSEAMSRLELRDVSPPKWQRNVCYSKAEQRACYVRN